MVIDVKPENTIDIVKFLVKQKTSIPINQFRLLHGGKELQPRFSVNHLGLRHGDTLNLCMRLVGGNPPEPIQTKWIPGSRSLPESGMTEELEFIECHIVDSVKTIHN